MCVGLQCLQKSLSEQKDALAKIVYVFDADPLKNVAEMRMKLSRKRAGSINFVKLILLCAKFWSFCELEISTEFSPPGNSFPREFFQ